jgi:hypothetical protein
MMARAGRVSASPGVAFALVVASFACHDPGQQGQKADVAPPSGSGAGAAPTTPPSPPAAVQPVSPLCRAVAVSGLVVPGDLPPVDAGSSPSIVAGTELAEGAWLSLEPAATLTVRYPRQPRETTIDGPARARPCVGRGDEAWLQRGKMQLQSVPGERPGADAWVLTPVGAVRLAGGTVTVEVSQSTATSAMSLRVEVERGAAFGWTAEPPPSDRTSASPAPDGWVQVDPGQSWTVALTPGRSPLQAARTAATRCTAEAQAAKELAAIMARPGANLSELAPKHVIARRRAHAACGVAQVRVEGVPPSGARDALAASLRGAESAWRAYQSSLDAARPR